MKTRNSGQNYKAYSWLDDRMIGARITAGWGFLRHIQTGCGANPVSHPMYTGGSFPGG